MGSWLSQIFPPKPKFTAKDIPDLTGKVAIVTGGNTGIGKETVKRLLEHNAKVYLAARSKERAESAIADLEKETGKKAIWLHLDLADLKSVKRAAEDFTARESQLHILFNNGGVMWPDIDQLTRDGYDLQFGTNVLGHFYFTKLLLPTLIETARSTPEGKVRVVNTSSDASMMIGGIHYDCVTGENFQARKKLGVVQLYAQSKFGNVVFSNELAKRYADQGIVSTSLHPGIIKTELARNAAWYVKLLFLTFMFLLQDVEHGALTQIYAGTAPEALELNGKYLIPWARVGEPRKETRDADVGKKLWDWLEEQVAPFERPVPN